MPSGHLGPALTVSNYTCSSPFRPHFLVADVSIWGYFSAGSCFYACNLWVLFIFPPGYVALQDSKTSPRPASERVSWCLETSPIKTPFPGRVSIPNSFVSLFIFYILSHLLSKIMGCFSRHLMSSARDQKLFCGVCSAFKCSFNEFVGEKVVSLSYSSSTLAPPPSCSILSSIIMVKNSSV